MKTQPRSDGHVQCIVGSSSGSNSNGPGRNFKLILLAGQFDVFPFHTRRISIESHPRYHTDSRTFGCEFRYEGSGRYPQQANPGPILVPTALHPPDEATTQPGDLWILGDHRLLCGDAASAVDVDRLLDGQGIHLVNTDPPYNVKVEPRSSTAIAAGMSSHPDLSKRMHHQGFDVARGVTDPKKAQKKMRAKDRPLVNDFVSDEDFAKMLLAWFGEMARVLEEGRSFYIWGG